MNCPVMHDNDNDQACIFTEHNTDSHVGLHDVTYPHIHSNTTYKLSDNLTDSQITCHNINYPDNHKLTYRTHCTYIFEKKYFVRCCR